MGVFAETGLQRVLPFSVFRACNFYDIAKKRHVSLSLIPLNSQRDGALTLKLTPVASFLFYRSALYAIYVSSFNQTFEHTGFAQNTETHSVLICVPR